MLWVKKRLGPPAEPLDTVEALEAAKKANEVFLLGFFTEQKVCPLYRHILGP